jgi:hypothetical protein
MVNGDLKYRNERTYVNGIFIGAEGPDLSN